MRPLYILRTTGSAGSLCFPRYLAPVAALLHVHARPSEPRRAGCPCSHEPEKLLSLCSFWQMPSSPLSLPRSLTELRASRREKFPCLHHTRRQPPGTAQSGGWREERWMRESKPCHKAGTGSNKRSHLRGLRMVPFEESGLGSK